RVSRLPPRLLVDDSQAAGDGAYRLTGGQVAKVARRERMQRLVLDAGAGNDDPRADKGLVDERAQQVGRDVLEPVLRAQERVAERVIAEGGRVQQLGHVVVRLTGQLLHLVRRR